MVKDWQALLAEDLDLEGPAVDGPEERRELRIVLLNRAAVDQAEQGLAGLQRFQRAAEALLIVLELCFCSWPR